MLSKCLLKLLFIIQPLSTVFTHSALQDDAAAATQTPKSTEKIATVHTKATLVLLTSSSIAGGQGTTGNPPRSLLVPFLQCSLALRHHYLVHGLRAASAAAPHPDHQRALPLKAGREMENFF